MVSLPTDTSWHQHTVALADFTCTYDAGTGNGIMDFDEVSDIGFDYGWEVKAAYTIYVDQVEWVQ